MLSERDLRWNLLQDTSDSRKREEKDPKSPYHVPKSRWSGVNHYLSNHPNFVGKKLDDTKKHNVRKEFLDKLKDAGLPDRLAYHYAYLCSQDPLIVLQGHTEYDENSTDHFEILNSTAWPSIRFKPPPELNSDIGWRVEFRTLDVQITDYENAAMVVLINLLVKILTHFEIDASLPISLCDINLERANMKDALTKQKFWFRRNIVNKDSDYTQSKGLHQKWKFNQNEEFSSSDETMDSEEEKDSGTSNYVEMTVADILEGNPAIGNVGLIQLFNEYMDLNDFSEEEKHFHTAMLDFLRKRARGEIKTGARWIRNFVMKHPAYQRDSIINGEIAYDLVREIGELGHPFKWDKSFLGEKPDFMTEYVEI